MVRLAIVKLYKSVQLQIYDFTPLQLFYSAFQCSVTWTPAGVGVGRVGVGVARLMLIRYRDPSPQPRVFNRQADDKSSSPIKH
jgi:hypothetical protein